MKRSLYIVLLSVGFQLVSSDLFAQTRVVGKFGRAQVQGQNVVVHVLVAVAPGLDDNAVADAALANQGARPFKPGEFNTNGLVWDGFFDSDPSNDFVTQYYNDANDPTGGQALSALTTTHNTWNSVSTSSFSFDYGGTTDTCPSLVRECPGKQTFDGYNDVGWLSIKGCCTLGVTWYGTSIDEADMALNTDFSWDTSGGDFDVETVYLHENGHELGLGHSNISGAVMEASYAEVRRDLHQDDIDGVTALYPLDNGGGGEVDPGPDPGPQGDTVSVLDVSFSREGGRFNDKHLLTEVSLIDDLGNPVAGAAVSIVLSNASNSWNGNGTTGSNGSVTFTLKNAASGCYAVEVTSVVANGLQWSPNDPASNTFQSPECN